MTVDPARLRHELRTPLNHILGYAEMLLDEPGEWEPAVTATLRGIRDEARRLTALVDGAAATLEAASGGLPSEFVAPLDRVLVLAETLRDQLGGAGAPALVADADRIAGAARHLLAVVHAFGSAGADHVVPGSAGQQAPAPPALAPGSRDAVAWPAVPVPAADPTPRRGTVLVVDDNAEARELLARRLAREGYDVRTADGGVEALAVLGATPVDLVLLDVLMPDLDGYEVLRRLKADPARRDLPVLMVSALDEVESVARCLDLGAEDYLPKPFDPVILRARIGACLEKKRLRDREARHLHELAEWSRTLEERVQSQLVQLDRLSRLKRFFSPQLAELIVAGGAEDPLRTHRREITVTFLDLRGFTPFAETAEPEEVMAVLREYHEAMGALILRHEGTLERFAGDGMMVFFNDPVPVPDPATRAVRMAIAMRERVGALRAGWAKRGHDLDLGIGITQGYATIGAIGFEGRWDYGAIGTVTNLAARLCGEAGGGQILVSARVAAAVEAFADLEEIGPLALKGLLRPVPAYNVVRLRATGG